MSLIILMNREVMKQAQPAAILIINSRALFSLRAQPNALGLSERWPSNSSTPLAQSQRQETTREHFFAAASV